MAYMAKNVNNMIPFHFSCCWHQPMVSCHIYSSWRSLHFYWLRIWLMYNMCIISTNGIMPHTGENLRFYWLRIWLTHIDINQKHHATYIHIGEVCNLIGSEYDWYTFHLMIHIFILRYVHFYVHNISGTDICTMKWCHVYSYWRSAFLLVYIILLAHNDIS